jgi:hypothetical protein
MSQVKALAKEAASNLETRKRTNGDEYVTRVDGAPDWLKDLCHHAHDVMLPDDWRYQFISDALDALAEHDDRDEAYGALEASIYTSELTAWLHSRASRGHYVDLAIAEWGKGDDLSQDLAMGQLNERWEVFNLVADYLEGLAEDDEEEAS